MMNQTKAGKEKKANKEKIREEYLQQIFGEELEDDNERDFKEEAFNDFFELYYQEGTGDYNRENVISFFANQKVDVAGKEPKQLIIDMYGGDSDAELGADYYDETTTYNNYDE